jgi:hypothetical protein
MAEPTHIEGKKPDREARAGERGSGRADESVLGEVLELSQISDATVGTAERTGVYVRELRRGEYDLKKLRG